ncbi:MAG: GNAT family N-acetyltransferase [Eubacteriales bacterium]|nr:GNAT family N-acetyltransferase [Eubacteriales bacterium]
MEIKRLQAEHIPWVAPLAADFRVTLNSFKRILSVPDLAAGAEELQEYLNRKDPVFMALSDSHCAGYMVCRIEEPCVWVESLFVARPYRRQGVATLLFHEAEAIAASYGADTAFNYVHPNNDTMIAFLRKNGYTVLNLIEIRKPYKGEKLSSTICVGEHPFDY